jgi:hypothetical protein
LFTLKGDIYLPLCFTCNKRWVSSITSTDWTFKHKNTCPSCKSLPLDVFKEMYEKAEARQAEMKYKKD